MTSFPVLAQQLPEILQLLSKLQAEIPEQQPIHPGDLLWWILQTEPFPIETALQAFRFAGGELAGFAFADPADWAVLQLHPAFEPILEAVVLMEAHAKKHASSGALNFRVGSGDFRLIEVLKSRGYVQQEDQSTLLDCTHATKPPVLPARHQLVSMAEFQDVPVRVKLHQQVWNSQRLQVGAYQKLQQNPRYSPELDLLILDPDGKPAAYALTWLDQRSASGVFEPVGVHPDHRKKGLGLAVVRAGLQKLRDSGATKVLVSTRSSNEAALALYRAAGFKTAGFYLNFALQL